MSPYELVFAALLQSDLQRKQAMIAADPQLMSTAVQMGKDVTAWHDAQRAKQLAELTTPIYRSSYPLGHALGGSAAGAALGYGLGALHNHYRTHEKDPKKEEEAAHRSRTYQHIAAVLGMALGRQAGKALA